jgi:hypothetical protein
VRKEQAATMDSTTLVDQYMERLDHPMKREVQFLRTMILEANDQITERIKWNAPSFCYEGDDRVTFNLHAKDRIRLIFHRGAKAKNGNEFTFPDSTGLLEWAASDRAVLTLKNAEDVSANAPAVAALVQTWVEAVARA